MRLLLTSAGIQNKTMVQALHALVPGARHFAFIPTAANVETGDLSWLDENIEQCKALGVVDVVDIEHLAKHEWLARLEQANVLVFGGGNPFHLMRCITQSGLEQELPRLLQTRVYVGISAGSMVANPSLSVSQSQNIYGEDFDKNEDLPGLHYVDFYTLPHLGSQHFPNCTEEHVALEAKKVHHLLYLLDDESAVLVVDGKVQIITEGTTKKL